MKAILDRATVLPNLFWVKGRRLAQNMLLRGAPNPPTPRPCPGRHGHAPIGFLQLARKHLSLPWVSPPSTM